MNADFTKDGFTPVQKHCWLRLKRHKWFLHETRYGVESELQGTYYRRRIYMCSECRTFKIKSDIGVRVVNGSAPAKRPRPPDPSPMAPSHLKLVKPPEPEA